MEGENQEKLNKTEELERRRNDAEFRINKFKDKIMRNFSEEEQKILEQNIVFLVNISAGSEEFEYASRDLWLNKKGSEEAVVKLLTDFSRSVLHNIRESAAHDFAALLIKNGKNILQEKFWGTPTNVLDFKELKEALQKIENLDVSLIQELASSDDFKDLSDFYKKNEQIILTESGHPVAEEFYKKLSDALLKLFAKEKPTAAGIVVPEKEIKERKKTELKSVKIKIKNKEGEIVDKKILFEESTRGWENFGFAPWARIKEKQIRYKDEEEVRANPFSRLGTILGVDHIGNLKYLRDGGIEGTGVDWTLRVKDKDSALDFIEVITPEEEAQMKLRISEAKKAKVKEDIEIKDIALLEITEENKEGEYKRFNRLHNDINNKYFSYIYGDDEISEEDKDAIKSKINKAGEILILGLRNITIIALDAAFKVLKEANDDINKILRQKKEAAPATEGVAERIRRIEEIVSRNLKKYEMIKASDKVMEEYKVRLYEKSGLDKLIKLLEELKTEFKINLAA